MSFELKLALKYFRVRRKSLARFTSFVAIVGIAAGVASLIIAQSLASGFADEIRDKILANTAHISIFMRDGGEIYNWKDVKNELEKSENIKEISETTFESGVIIGKETNAYAILRVVSHQPLENNEQRTTNNEQIIEILIGKELAEKTNLKIGDEAEIVTIENESAKTSKVKIKDIFQTGLYEYDSTWINLSPENYVKLTGKPKFTPTVLNVSVKDIYKADKTADEIRIKLGEVFKVLDWQEANQPLFAALSLERRVALAIISLIIFIAALNITTTLALLVNERKLDIAVLRTCGAKTKNLIFVFLLEGLFLGFTGIFFGVVFGLSGCFIGNYFNIIKLPTEVYSLNYIPFHPDLVNILLIIFIAFILCLAATVYPAYKASRIKPLENLRTQ
jgi:lipoprotein-releasing system permease protein